jgi:hypothetical protein
MLPSSAVTRTNPTNSVQKLSIKLIFMNRLACCIRTMLSTKNSSANHQMPSPVGFSAISPQPASHRPASHQPGHIMPWL